MEVGLGVEAICPPKLRVRVGLNVVMVGLVDLVKLLFVERRIIVPTNKPSRAAWPWEPAMLEGGRGVGWGRYGERGDKAVYR